MSKSKRQGYLGSGLSDEAFRASYVGMSDTASPDVRTIADLQRRIDYWIGEDFSDTDKLCDTIGIGFRAGMAVNIHWKHIDEVDLGYLFVPPPYSADEIEIAGFIHVPKPADGSPPQWIHLSDLLSLALLNRVTHNALVTSGF